MSIAGQTSLVVCFCTVVLWLHLTNVFCPRSLPFHSEQSRLRLLPQLVSRDERRPLLDAHERPPPQHLPLELATALHPLLKTQGTITSLCLVYLRLLPCAFPFVQMKRLVLLLQSLRVLHFGSDVDDTVLHSLQVPRSLLCEFAENAALLKLTAPPADVSELSLLSPSHTHSHALTHTHAHARGHRDRGRRGSLSHSQSHSVLSTLHNGNGDLLTAPTPKTTTTEQTGAAATTADSWKEDSKQRAPDGKLATIMESESTPTAQTAEKESKATTTPTQTQTDEAEAEMAQQKPDLMREVSSELSAGVRKTQPQSIWSRLADLADMEHDTEASFSFSHHDKDTHSKTAAEAEAQGGTETEIQTETQAVNGIDDKHTHSRTASKPYTVHSDRGEVKFSTNATAQALQPLFSQPHSRSVTFADSHSTALIGRGHTNLHTHSRGHTHTHAQPEFEFVAQLPHLHTLILSGCTKITDEGLDFIKFPSLLHVNLQGVHRLRDHLTLACVLFQVVFRLPMQDSHSSPGIAHNLFLSVSGTLSLCSSSAVCRLS